MPSSPSLSPCVYAMTRSQDQALDLEPIVELFTTDGDTTRRHIEIVSD
jgi:hypothetical protein